jgi:hypothetical protein
MLNSVFSNLADGGCLDFFLVYVEDVVSIQQDQA